MFGDLSSNNGFAWKKGICKIINEAGNVELIDMDSQACEKKKNPEGKVIAKWFPANLEYVREAIKTRSAVCMNYSCAGKLPGHGCRKPGDFCLCDYHSSCR